MVRTAHRLKATSVLSLVLCVLAQLAGSVHSAAVAHVACEHGGVVELRGDAKVVAAAPAHLAIAAADAETHHDHCEGCATPSARDTYDPELAPLKLAPSPSEGALPLFAPAAPISVLAFAPKGSPPAAPLSA